LLCFFLFSSPWCFLVIKRKCVFHFSHYYYLFLSSSYDYPQNMSCFFLFSLFLCCCFLFFLSYHCSTATMVSFRSPLYLPMDQIPGTLLFTPRYFGFMDAHPSVMWYFIGVDHVWSIIMSTPDSLDCSIGSYSSSSQPSPIKPTKGHQGVYWSGDWRYLVLFFLDHSRDDRLRWRANQWLIPWMDLLSQCSF
jgi:hypothetical protein